MLKTPESKSRDVGPGLSSLARVALSPPHEALWQAVARTAGGSPVVRERKLAEARDLLALAQVSRRLTVMWIDLSADLRALVEMLTPVPCLPDPAGPLQVAPRALLGVMYPETTPLRPQPGHAFVRILAPGPVFHPNVAMDSNQALCLGPTLPAGIPLREILLLTYGALTMANVQMDWGDPAGIVNREACAWFQARPDRIPLSREPFIRPEESHGV